MGPPSVGSAPTTPTAINTALGLLAVTALIGANAFFVAAEFAMVAVDRVHIDQRATAGDRSALAVRSILSRLSFHLSGAQLGITVSSLALGFVAEPAIAAALEPLFRTRLAPGVSVAVALLVATVAQMVVGELIPKNLAIARPTRTAVRLAPPVRVYGIVAGPLITVLNGAANWTVRRVGIEPTEELSHVRSLGELELLIQSAGREGVIEPQAVALITRTIRFGDKTAADALVPRVQVVAVEREATLADLVALVGESGFSRFPVIGTDLDDVLGVVHAKAAQGRTPEARAATAVEDVMEAAFVVPETRDLESLLVELRTRRSHLAIVVDEYGGTAGIVTLEDLLEEIVGEIDDEHDRQAAVTTRLGDSGDIVVGGSLHLDEVADLCGLELPEGDYETIAGFLLARLGHIPAVGEWTEHEGWEIEVARRDGLRVSEVRLVSPRRSADRGRP